MQTRHLSPNEKGPLLPCAGLYKTEETFLRMPPTSKLPFPELAAMPTCEPPADKGRGGGQNENPHICKETRRPWPGVAFFQVPLSHTQLNDLLVLLTLAADPPTGAWFLSPCFPLLIYTN